MSVYLCVLSSGAFVEHYFLYLLSGNSLVLISVSVNLYSSVFCVV